MKKLKALVIFLPIISAWLITFTSPDCRKVRKGEFYFYPPDKRGPFKLVRYDSIQYEIDLGSKDTSTWKLQWLNDCTVRSNFISATNKLPAEMMDFFNSHTIYLEIMKVTEKYYYFKVSLDSLTSHIVDYDTAWFNAK